MNNFKVFGVEIDEVTEDQVVEQIDKWLGEGRGSKVEDRRSNKHYIVTPNIEFLMQARQDAEFRKILNAADLKIPDSSRFNWVKAIQNEKNVVKRLLIWPFFLYSSVKILPSFPVTTGADLMSRLREESTEKAYRIGLIGGGKGLAEKVRQRYLGDKQDFGIVFTDSSIKVDKDGNTLEWVKQNDILSKDLDILFVGLGQVKQEKWIVKNLDKIPARVFIGVGGAIDYLSGDIARAPLFMRRLGLEWLFRVILQPWRIKRFGVLVKFVFLILFEKSKK